MLQVLQLMEYFVQYFLPYYYYSYTISMNVFFFIIYADENFFSHTLLMCVCVCVYFTHIRRTRQLRRHNDEEIKMEIFLMLNTRYTHVYVCVLLMYARLFKRITFFPSFPMHRFGFLEFFAILSMVKNIKTLQSIVISVKAFH